MGINRRCCYAACLSLLVTLSPALSAENSALQETEVLNVEVIPDIAHVELLTPALKERKTRKVKLANGLEAYLVSDPHTESSGALLAVRSGSWQDPIEYPGMAHFLEHMLFLGNQAYPDESDYDRYITEYGGNLNAFTTSDYTAYLFTVDNQALPGALDRFAHFFIDPLFNPSGVAREMQAIEQEYAKNVEDDSFRLLYVLKEIGDPKHPQNRFNMGNNLTLSSVSQELLKNWYRQHYSANLMRLMVVSTLPIEELEQLVVDEFSAIPNYNFPLPTAENNSTSPYSFGHFIFVEPTKKMRSLILNWEFPPELYNPETRDGERLISFILGHEGDESLIAQLRREKLADELCSGILHVGDRLSQLTIEIGLTPEGLNQVHVVIERVFQAINLMRQEGIPRSLFDEVQRSEKLAYQYQERQDLFADLSSHASDFVEEPLSSYPEHTQIISYYNPDAIKKVLNFLTPQNCQFVIMAPQSETGVKLDHQERWLKAPYTLVPIAPDRLEHWAKINRHPKIDLPAINPFIPTQLTLFNTLNPDPSQEYIVKPKKILDEKQITLYFAPDRLYGVPQLYGYLEVRTPQIDLRDPQKIVFGDIYAKAVKEALSKYSYPAQMAGLNYSVDTTDNGLGITIFGYSENMPILFAEIAKKLRETTFDEASYKIYKDSLLRQYQSFEKEYPLRQALDQFKDMIYEHYVTSREKTTALRRLSYAKAKELASTLFQQNYILGIFYGNIREQQAKKMGELLRQTLGGTPYPLAKQYQREVIILPEGQGPFYLETNINANGNAALLAVESTPFSFKARAAQQIAMQAIDQAFFDALRTKQQTGYLVTTSPEEIELQLFDLFGVQSNTHEVRDLLARFELFIEGFLQNLSEQNLSETRFETIRNSLLTQLTQPPPNLNEMGRLLKRLLFSYQADFDWKTKRIEAFKQLTYSEFKELTQNFLGKKNKRRVAILLKGSIPEDNVFDYHRLKNGNELQRVSSYQTFQEQLHALPAMTTDK